MKSIIFTVTNDLVSDQRVHRICSSLTKAGFDVKLIGRRFRTSQPVSERPYLTKRIRLIFNTGFLFYASFNIRVFFILLFSKAEIFTSNDLDTLPANFVVSKLRRKALVYDSHEYFTEMPELIGRDFVRKTWLKIEQKLLPKVRYSYTVCDSLARIYNQKYDIGMKVIRNLPIRSSENKRERLIDEIKSKRVIIYQGSVNIGRGIESVLEAIKLIDNVIFLIIGEGDIMHKIREKASEPELKGKVLILGKLLFEELPSITKKASVGISLEENLGLNYYYALPNKLFDYIQAEIPVLVSKFPEMQNIVESENVGLTVDSNDPEHISEKLKTMLFDDDLRSEWKRNLAKASEKYCWENEESELLKIYSEI